MPSTSEKQARFMAACSHGAGYKSCPPSKVSTEFNQADKGTPMLKHAVARLKRAVGGLTNTGQLGSMNLPGMAHPTLPPYTQNPYAPTYGAPAPHIGMMNRPLGPPGGAPNGGVVGPGMQSPLGMVGPQAGQPPVMGGAPHPMVTNPGPVAPPMPTSGAMRPPMPMGGQHMMPSPMQGNRMIAAKGGRMLPPPGPGGGNYSPQPSPLASLISNKMAAQHAGFPGVRKPRIPLPGAMRNINQNLHNAKTKLGAIKLGR